ncbi:hypothetical protein NUW58_g3627 [Xylaria curta]|uniref:Uncharacterized protein n=1 Tax=Xylaria curta TaxID=42375 RepID=A0ACC1PCT5_9PEZI|nr:hypothetical protein NUW58_g3627 [Xylaria curta]
MASTGPNMSQSLIDRETVLKEKYIELLEKRVAQLEALINPTQEPPGEPKTLGQPGGGTKSLENVNPVNADIGPTNRYRNVVRKWDNATGSYRDNVLSEDAHQKTPSKDVAYTFRRVYDVETGEKGAYSEVDIEGDGLITLLKSKLDKYPGVNFDGDIVHYWDELQKLVEVNPEQQDSKDLTHLLQRVQSSEELSHYFKNRESNRNAKVTTYETLWTEFAPNMLVVTKPFMNTEQILRVSSTPIPYTRGPRSRAIMLAWCWDWDGKKMVKAYYELKFDRFRGTKPVNELPSYPLQYHQNETKLRAKILGRAERFIMATVLVRRGAGQMFKYNANAYRNRNRVIAEPESDDEEANLPAGHPVKQDAQNPKVTPIKGEIISDAQSFLQYGNGPHPLGEWNSLWVEDAPSDFDESLKKPDSVLNMSDQNILMLPPRILGYATREKMWAQFSVDSAEEPAGKNPENFEKNLQLDQTYKDLIEALVESHQVNQATATKQVKDFVDDKGRGLVLLLHGPPGVGKTLTAETIAEKTGKPLFIVSVAEIGLNASQAERNLEKLFMLATKWEAILLIDEADVFLETRGATSSASRNALVSVLLRVLEYYRGIVILTTNRIKSIDVAVISRIHLAIQYKDLKSAQTQKIFKYFLDQLEPSMVKDREKIDSHISLVGRNIGLNGRQIRNVVSGALAKSRDDCAKERGMEGCHLKT